MAKRFLSPINFNNLSSDPISANTGDFYYNTIKHRLRYYNGIAWKNVSQFLIESDTAPSNPDDGDMWYNTLKIKTYIWYDNYWIETTGGYPMESGSSFNIDGGSSSSIYGGTNKIDCGTSIL